MDPMTPAYSTGVLLTIAALAVALLLVLIIRVKLHAFLALVLVSVLTALAARVPLADVPAVLLSGFGSTLASVALLVGLGAMLGRLLEVSGGAQALADTLIGRFGESRAPLALGVASLIFGFPIFFDAGLVVFLPIILTVARRFGGSLLLYALPSAGAFAAMHAIVPPHPGPVTAADLLGANVGWALLIGLPGRGDHLVRRQLPLLAVRRQAVRHRRTHRPARRGQRWPVRRRRAHDHQGRIRHGARDPAPPTPADHPQHRHHARSAPPAWSTPRRPGCRRWC